MAGSGAFLFLQFLLFFAGGAFASYLFVFALGIAFEYRLAQDVVFRGRPTHFLYNRIGYLIGLPLVNIARLADGEFCLDRA